MLAWLREAVAGPDVDPVLAQFPWSCTTCLLRTVWAMLVCAKQWRSPFASLRELRRLVKERNGSLQHKGEFEAHDPATMHAIPAYPPAAKLNILFVHGRNLIESELCDGAVLEQRDLLLRD